MIADEVRGSVRDAMKSLQADLAAARTAQPTSAPRDDSDDPRVASREELRRADAVINEFRGQVRADLRAHVARGGVLAASVVDDLTKALDAAAREITRAIRG